MITSCGTIPGIIVFVQSALEELNSIAEKYGTHFKTLN
jgi:hypothetical protein